MEERVRELEVPLTILGRLRRMVMGSRTPGLFTKIFFWSGLVLSWGYFMIWYVISYVALISIHGLLDAKPEARVRAYFTEIGQAYGIDDAFNTYKLFCLIQIMVLLVVLFGLFFTWRRWKIGPYLFIFGNLATVGITVFLLSWSFYMEEITIVDKSIQGLSILGGVIILLLQNQRRKYTNNKYVQK